MSLRLMLLLAVLFPGLAALSGCRTHAALRDNTLQTTATLADLNCQQVVDNVARFACHLDTLPSVAVINNGTVMVSDQQSAGGAATYTPTISLADQIGGFPIFSLFFSPNTSRSLTENWDLKPVTDAEKIRRIRSAFQVLLGAPLDDGPGSDDRRETVDALLSDGKALEEVIPVGWYGIGCQKEVPRDACYVGNCRDTYVWVTSDGIDGLSQFTLTVMLLATSNPEPVTRSVIRRYDSEGKLQTTEITATEPLEPQQINWQADADEDQNSESDSVAAAPRSALPNTPRRTALTPRQARTRKGLSGNLQPHSN